MHVTDVHDADRILQDPNDVITILDQPYRIHDSNVSRMEMRLYVTEAQNRPYSIITIYVEVDGHTIETIYHEGYLSGAPLRDAAKFLVSNLGPSGAILRAKIALDAALSSGKV